MHVKSRKATKSLSTIINYTNWVTTVGVCFMLSFYFWQHNYYNIPNIVRNLITIKWNKYVIVVYLDNRKFKMIITFIRLYILSVTLNAWYLKILRSQRKPKNPLYTKVVTKSRSLVSIVLNVLNKQALIFLTSFSLRMSRNVKMSTL